MPTPDEVRSVTGQEVSLHGPQSGGSAPTVLLSFTPAGGSQTQRRPVGRRGLSRRQTSLDRIFSLDPPLEQKIKTQVRSIKILLKHFYRQASEMAFFFPPL